MTSRIFISYRRDDSKYQARMIHSAFCRVLPREHVFMDIDSIPPGANFRKILRQWIDQCEIVLALIGPGWIDATDPRTNRRRLDENNDFVRIEIAESLARDIAVVPVLIDGTKMPDVDQLPDDLRELVQRQAEFIEYRTFDADVARLIKKLKLADAGFDEHALNIVRSAGRDNISDRVKTIITDHLGVDSHHMTGAATLESLGADRLDCTELVLAMEKEFGTRFSNADIGHLTVDGIIAYIRPASVG